MRSYRSRLELLLPEQCDYLMASAARFDEGYHHESKRLAVTLRVLVHDTRDSASLLGQLGVKDTLSYLDADARKPAPPGTQVMYPVGWPVGLVGMRSTGGAGWDYFPMLDSDPDATKRRRSFADWWGRRLLSSPTIATTGGDATSCSARPTRKAELMLTRPRIAGGLTFETGHGLVRPRPHIRLGAQSP